MQPWFSLACFLFFPVFAQEQVLPEEGAAYRLEEVPPRLEPLAYRNAVNMPPADWTGPVFQLSHAYPKQKPHVCDKKQCPWLGIEISFKDDIKRSNVPHWGEPYTSYLQAILAYVREGQDENLANQIGINTQVEQKTRWFHVPWMAYDLLRGREFVHGLTNERTAHVDDFFSKQIKRMQPNHPGFETWAVGLYNDYGGYSLGQAWNRSGDPQFAVNRQGLRSLKGLPFMEGTVVVKFLFSSVTPKDIYYLTGSPKWQANRHVLANNQYICTRKVQDVHLVQVDVAVVDSRSPTNWVYGTFAYNSQLKGKNVWQNLSPVGLQWGMDPWTFPAVPRSSSIPVRQSVLNRDNINVKSEHYGCEGRLAGPVDNKLSSCLSCHGGAFTHSNGDSSQSVPPIFGFPSLCEQYSLANMSYFQSIKYPEIYAGGRYPDLISLDTSLQLQVALQQWYNNINRKPKPKC